MQAAINRVNEADLPRDGVYGADATGGETASAAGDLIVNVSGRKHRAVTPFAVGFVEAAFEPALAAGELLPYLGIHLKSLGS
jgi:hypothetical protein